MQPRQLGCHELLHRAAICEALRAQDQSVPDTGANEARECGRGAESRPHLQRSHLHMRASQVSGVRVLVQNTCSGHCTTVKMQVPHPADT